MNNFKLLLAGNKSKYFIFICFLFLLILYRLVGYSGHFGSDDMEYAEVSHQLSMGEFDASNHFSFRLALTLPTALCYKIFGINDVSSSIPPIIASSLILLLVFKMVQKENIHTIALALSICLFSQWFLFYGNKLMVDIYLCLAFTAALFILFQLNFKKSDSYRLYGILFALAIFYGFNAKGSIILILPMLLYLFIFDLLRKKNFDFWKWSILTIVALLSAYLAMSKIFFGDYFIRFQAIQDNGYINPCSFNDLPIQFLKQRLGIDFFRMISNEGFLLPLAILFSLFLKRNFLRHFKMNSPLSFFLITSFLLLLSSNFMSISLKGYNPMCIDFRHYLFLVPPTAIGAAMVLGNLKIWQEYKFQLLLLLLIPLIFSFQQHASSFFLIYLPSFAILMIFSFFKSNQIKATLFSLLLIGSFLIKPLEMVSNARKNKYPKQVKLIKEQLIEKEDKAVILTDHVQSRIGNYLSGFSKNVKFIPYAKVDQAIGENHKFLLINPYTEFFSLLTTDDYPFFVKHAFSEDSIIFESQSPELKVFRLNRIVAPSFNGELLLESFNKDFKPQKPYWDQEERLIQVDPASGNPYYKVGEYSATFKYPLDSLKLDSAKNLYFQAELKTKFFDSTEAVLVFDLKSGDDSYFWKGFPVQKFQKTTNHWWTVKFDESIAYSAIKPNSVLSIYLWNVDQKETYIDDFKIKVIAF